METKSGGDLMVNEAVQVLSTFYSDDGKRTATVYRLLLTKDYQTAVTNDAGVSFSAKFENAADAENFAEDWVLPQ